MNQAKVVACLVLVVVLLSVNSFAVASVISIHKSYFLPSCTDTLVHTYQQVADAPFRFVNIHDPKVREEMHAVQQRTGKHWLDAYKNANPEAREYLAEAGKLVLTLDEQRVDIAQLTAIVQQNGGKVLPIQPEGRRYLSFPDAVDLRRLREELLALDGVQTAGFSLLGKGTCALDYDNHGNAPFNDQY